MQRRPVESSSLASVGYEEWTRTLEVEFRNGGVYHYLDVPASVHRALMTAESAARSSTPRSSPTSPACAWNRQLEADSPRWLLRFQVEDTRQLLEVLIARDDRASRARAVA